MSMSCLSSMSPLHFAAYTLPQIPSPRPRCNAVLTPSMGCLYRQTLSPLDLDWRVCPHQISANLSVLCPHQTSADSSLRTAGNLLLTAAIARTPALRRTNTNRLVLQLCLAGAAVSGTNVPLVLAALLAATAGQVGRRANGAVVQGSRPCRPI